MISSCIFSAHADVNSHADTIYILRFIRCLVYYQRICFVTFFSVTFSIRGEKIGWGGTLFTCVDPAGSSRCGCIITVSARAFLQLHTGKYARNMSKSLGALGGN